MKIGPNDDVGVPAYSCVALANAVLAEGATPVPLDCDPQTLSLTKKTVQARVTSRMKCLIGVNTFGLPMDFSQIAELEIPLIEDCAHGFSKGGMGGRGSLSIFSFYATKFIGSGRGGAIATNDSSFADAIRNHSDYSDKPMSGERMNAKFDDLNAALVLSQIEHIDHLVEIRRKLANTYLREFDHLQLHGILKLPQVVPERIWYRFVISVVDAHKWKTELARLGVVAELPVWNWLDEDGSARCPNAASAYENTLSLPIYPSLSTNEQERVIDAVTTLAEYLG